VTLYRDNHGWCPYCQKIWLFLEEKKVPYKIEKVTMFCYGQKEAWYTKIVPSGMLPAVEIDGQIITESDVCLFQLERAFGPLGKSMADITAYRQLERQLFGAWCGWLCRPAVLPFAEANNKKNFEAALADVDKSLSSTPGPYFLGEEFTAADVIFIPYVERMLASLYYYKGFNIKEASPAIAKWFAALETRETYRGTQSDAHTHSHDLPPQMGGCFENGEKGQLQCKANVDEGPWEGLPDVGYPEPSDAVQEALARTMKHRVNLINANCIEDKAKVDEALRCAMTTLVSEPGKHCSVTDKDMAIALTYIKDRVNVPRDMSIWAGRRMRTALATTAAAAGPVGAPPIPTQNRYDQQPAPFAKLQPA
jgi:glutathione S-transferase